MKRVPCYLLALGLVAVSAVGQVTALARLNESPRHHEWVEIEHDGRAVRSFLVFPESDLERPAVVVIHENRGLTDWVRSTADRLAEAGYIAIAPDLLSGMGPGGGGTESFADSDAARAGIYELSEAQVTADLQAVTEFVKALPGANGTVSVGGFCWGGSQAFRFATERNDLAAAYVFYGRGPQQPEALARISAPVYGFYGGSDARVNETVPATVELMTHAGKTYEPVTYEGAGHGFMRSGEAPDASPANRKAWEEAWSRWLEKLARH